MDARFSPIRGFLLDPARTLESRAYCYKTLEFLAKRGINRVIWHFTDDQGCQMHFKSVPGIGSLNAYTVNETRELICFARERGITLVPEIASLGHSRYITRLPRFRHLNENDDAYSGMCPVHPDTRYVIAALIRETIDVFDSPEIHVGLDEVEIGQHPLTRDALRSRSRAEIVSDHIRFVHDIVVREAGRKMWMWGDGLLAAPEMLTLIPKDIVVCNWQYRPAAAPSSTQQLLDAGFDVITASGLLTHDQTLFPSETYALKNVREMRSHRDLVGATTPARVRGEIVTTWIPSRSISGAQWLGWYLAADVLEYGDAAETESSVTAFGLDFYGLTDTGDFVQACRVLIDHAPQRAEWMAIAKLDLAAIEPAVAARLPALADEWARAMATLHVVKNGVVRNRNAFDAFLLLFELLSHCYSAALELLCGSSVETDFAQVQGLIGKRSDLLEKLSNAWDSERFADDPSKYTPVVHFFRDDHLLLIVQDGLDALQQSQCVPAETETTA